MLENFQKYGYHIEKSVTPIDLHEELFFIFYDLSLSAIKRNNIKIDFIPKKIDDCVFPNDIKELDRLLFTLLDFDRDTLGEIYDTVAYCSTFFKLISNSKIEELSREILMIKNKTPLYSTTHRIRMDWPEDEKRRAGWHQEIFHTYPDFKFIQTWSPIIRNSTVANGTIKVCPGSHTHGIAQQNWEDEKEGYATRIIIDEDVVQKYKEQDLPMEIGDVLFFDPLLFHRSGHNSSEEIRFSQVGMWNDCSTKGFRAPKPSFISRTYSPRDNYEKHMFGDKKKTKAE